MWLDGSGFWKGLQLDEVAAQFYYSILQADTCGCRSAILSGIGRWCVWPADCVWKWAFATPEDHRSGRRGRAGTACALASTIAALLAPRSLRASPETRCKRLRETADAWNASIEHGGLTREGIEAGTASRSRGLLRSPGAAPRSYSTIPCHCRRRMIAIVNHPGGKRGFRACGDGLRSMRSWAWSRFGLPHRRRSASMVEGCGSGTRRDLERSRCPTAGLARDDRRRLRWKR